MKCAITVPTLTRTKPTAGSSKLRASASMAPFALFQCPSGEVRTLGAPDKLGEAAPDIGIRT